jgi:hypothetical protein
MTDRKLSGPNLISVMYTDSRMLTIFSWFFAMAASSGQVLNSVSRYLWLSDLPGTCVMSTLCRATVYVRNVSSVWYSVEEPLWMPRGANGIARPDRTCTPRFCNCRFLNTPLWPLKSGDVCSWLRTNSSSPGYEYPETNGNSSASHDT